MQCILINRLLQVYILNLNGKCITVLRHTYTHTHKYSKVMIKISLKFLEIIKEYLPNEPKCLEIFARYLLPGWTSWGLEILKFQHLSLYEIIDESRKADNIRNENECDN